MHAKIFLCSFPRATSGNYLVSTDLAATEPLRTITHDILFILVCEPMMTFSGCTRKDAIPSKIRQNIPLLRAKRSDLFLFFLCKHKEIPALGSLSLPAPLTDFIDDRRFHDRLQVFQDVRYHKCPFIGRRISRFIDNSHGFLLLWRGFHRFFHRSTLALVCCWFFVFIKRLSFMFCFFLFVNKGLFC